MFEIRAYWQRYTALSPSPLIYEFLYKMYEINAKYCLLDIESEEGIVPYIWRMSEFGYVGFNITSPYKCSALKYADSLGENIVLVHLTRKV